MEFVLFLRSSPHILIVLLASLSVQSGAVTSEILDKSQEWWEGTSGEGDPPRALRGRTFERLKSHFAFQGQRDSGSPGVRIAKREGREEFSGNFYSAPTQSDFLLSHRPKFHFHRVWRTSPYERPEAYRKDFS